MSYQPPQYPQQPPNGPQYGQQPPTVPGYPPYGPSQPYGGPPAGYGPPPQGPVFTPPPAPKKSTNGRAVAIIAASVAGLCVFGGIYAAVTGKSDPKASVESPAGNTTAKDADKDKPAGKPKQPDTYNVALGSAITVSGDGGSAVKGTIKSAKAYKQACNDFAPAPDNGLFVVVDVVVEQTKGTGSVNPLDFTFVADDGATANGLSAAFSGCDSPSLSSTNSLRAGQKRSGKIAFDATSGKGTVEWAPGGLGAETVGSWKVG